MAQENTDGRVGEIQLTRLKKSSWHMTDGGRLRQMVVRAASIDQTWPSLPRGMPSFPPRASNQAHNCQSAFLLSPLSPSCLEIRTAEIEKYSWYISRNTFRPPSACLPQKLQNQANARAILAEIILVPQCKKKQSQLKGWKEFWEKCLKGFWEKCTQTLSIGTYWSLLSPSNSINPMETENFENEKMENWVCILGCGFGKGSETWIQFLFNMFATFLKPQPPICDH